MRALCGARRVPSVGGEGASCAIPTKREGKHELSARLPQHCTGGGALGNHADPAIKTREDFEKYPFDKVPALYAERFGPQFDALRAHMPEGMKAIGGIDTGSGALDFFLNFLIKLALLPVIAGVSYEILKLLARTQSPLVLPLKAPGYLLQKLTTKEPDDGMIECAVLAFEKVLDMDADPDSPEKIFITETKLSRLKEMMTEVFEKHGIDSSDAEWILSLTLNIPRSGLSEERIVTRAECEKIVALFEERLTGRPLWYIIGNTEFYGYPIEVDERVLIPRPETEILVQQAVSAVQEGNTVLDLCTGSGAIAVAIACEAAKDKNISVVAADISEGALEVARNNVRRNKANVVVVKSDLFENIQGKFNIITANPPYIRSAEIGTLQREVRDFEPRVALDGGEDGLDFYRRIAAGVGEHIARGGMLILECGEDQAQDILKIFSSCDYAMVVKDLAGKERIVKIVF